MAFIIFAETNESMLVFKSVDELQFWLDQKRSEGHSIGFAPTMGALHQGHLELVKKAKSEGDLAVVSIFVNPTQFNDAKDLEKYPRTPGMDMELLMSVDCDAVFLPGVEEVYPPGKEYSVAMDFKSLDSLMEGAFRPGHFAGMASVVWRLLEIVQPQNLYMGQKDFQQWTIVHEMLHQLGSPTHLVMCPTVRETDGLAMSSRNTRLTPEMREVAPIIYQTLTAAAGLLQTYPVAEVVAMALEQLENAGLKPEYFCLVDGFTLREIENRDSSTFVVACTAAWAGDVRLIDNAILKNQEA